MTSALERLRALRATRADHPPSTGPVVVTPEGLTASVEALLSKYAASSRFSGKASGVDPTELTEPTPDAGFDTEREGFVSSVSCQVGGLSENHANSGRPTTEDKFSKDMPTNGATELTEPSPTTPPSSQGGGCVGSVSSLSGVTLENHVTDNERKWRRVFEGYVTRRLGSGLSRAEAEAGALDDLAQQWRSENPLPASPPTLRVKPENLVETVAALRVSARGSCYHCGGASPDTPVLADDGHIWLHSECWAPMNEKRQNEALAAVRALLGAAP